MTRRVAYLFLLAMALLLPATVHAHLINYDLEKLPVRVVFWRYLLIGYEHIIPLGFDHILFIMCVFFLNTSLKKIILQASMFTIAHSITLGLAMYGIIKPPSSVIEPLIALSIVFLALENVFSDKVKPWRMVMVFLFGMVHGMGFAGALSQMGMPRYAFGEALVAFNVGVELGQLSIILVMYACVAQLFGRKPWYRKLIVIPSSLLIALVASFWTVQRIFFV
jgi:HupE / UreJ protein